MANVFDLEAVIRLNDSDFTEKLDEAGKAGESFSQKLKNAAGTAGKVAGVTFAAVGAATVATTKYLLDGAAQTAAYGDQVDKMSQKMGISAQAYQEWDAILQHSGSSIDSMQRGMMTLASAAEKGSDAFEAIGLSQEQVASMSREELFAATIKGLQGMEEGTERAVLAQELLGAGAKELGPLLNTSAEDTEAMRQAVHDLGGVMSDEAVKAAAKYQDSLQDMQTAFQGLQRGLFTKFMPGITQVMDGLAAIFSGDKEGGIKMISDGVHNLVDTISKALPEFIELGTDILSSLVQALIDNLPQLLESGGQLIGELVAGLVKAIPQLIKMAPQIVMGIVNGLASAWPSIKQAGVDLINMVGQGISSMISSAWSWGSDMIHNFINGIKSKASELWGEVKGLASGVANFLGFSEPKEGPLSNFHTYAPDMMALFAQGIRENESLVTDQIARSFDFSDMISVNAGDANYGATPGYGGDNVTINVYGAQGQSAEELAEKIEQIFVSRSRRRALLNA